MNFLNFNFAPFSFFLVFKKNICQERDYKEFYKLKLFVNEIQFEEFEFVYKRTNLIEIKLD